MSDGWVQIVVHFKYDYNYSAKKIFLQIHIRKVQLPLGDYMYDVGVIIVIFR